MDFFKLYRNVPSVLYFTTTRHLERGWNLTAVISRLNSLLAMRYSHGVHKNKISPHSYIRLCGKDGAGFEPTYTAWKATVLPLNYPSSGLPAVSFIYSHFHLDSAASQQLTAWTRCHWPMILSCIASQDSFNTAIPFRIRATATLDASIVNTDKESRTYQIYTTFLPFSPGYRLWI